MKGSWKVPVVAVILIAVFQVIALLLPFQKTTVFWISDGYIVFVLIMQCLIYLLAFKKGIAVTSKFYGWPVMRTGLIYLAVSGFCACLFIALSFTDQASPPVWLPVAVYVLLTGFAAIGLIRTDSVRTYVESQDIKLADRTVFMRKLAAEANALKGAEKDPEIKTILSKVADEIRYSDPTSSPESGAMEEQLYEAFDMMKETVMQKNLIEIQAACEQFHKQLAIRNEMCKINKK